jgi:hypothetical protein
MNPPRIVTWMGAALVLSLAGASATAAPPPASLDACRLISAQAVASLLMGPVARSSEESDESGSSCIYQLSPEGPLIILSVLAGDWAGIRSEYEDAPEATVGGLGQDAFWSERDHALQVLMPNGLVMRVSLDAQEDGWSGPRLRTLAIRVAAEALRGTLG